MPTFLRLWVHEMNRVFKDRLLDKNDHHDFDSLIRKYVVNKLEADANDVLGKDHILFADFLDKDPENRV